MAANAGNAAAFLKTLAHEGRLMILCHLADGEKTVGTLEDLLDMRQAAVWSPRGAMANPFITACRMATPKK